MSFLTRNKRRASRRVDRQTAYEMWAPRYPPTAHNALMRAEQEAMEHALQGLPPSRALDVGTGTGRYLGILENAGMEPLVAVDASQAMLDHARRGNWALVRSDARALPFGKATFDLILASLMVGDIADLAAWSREMSRVLRPGGSLLYSDFHQNWAALGWERTLRTRDGELVSVPFHVHTLLDHREASAGAGLEITACVEPLLEGVDAPVLVVVSARKCGT